MKEQVKLKLPRQVEDFFQVYAKSINGKYIYFPAVYEKLGNSEYRELEISELPEGIKKYLKEKLK